MSNPTWAIQSNPNPIPKFLRNIRFELDAHTTFWYGWITIRLLGHAAEGLWHKYINDMVPKKARTFPREEQ
jgi:hypothetical protein